MVGGEIKGVAFDDEEDTRHGKAKGDDHEVGDTEEPKQKHLEKAKDLQE